MSGNTVISLSEFEDYSKANNKDNSVSQKCCDVDNITLDLDYSSRLKVERINLFNTDQLAIDISNKLLKTVFIISDFNFYTNLPPPSGSELLKIVQAFRL